MTGAVVLPGGGGRSLTRGFLVAKKQFMDPICREGVAPIHAWCAEAWQRRERQGPMKTAWRYAERAVTDAARPWSRVRGPASAAWVSLSRIGWTFISPFVMRSDVGVEYDILHESPKRMLRRLKEACVRWGWRKVLKGKGWSEEEAADGAARVYTGWHRTALFGKHNASAEERGAARAVMDGSAWTEARCCQAGYLQFPICKWCQAAVGSMKHRLFQCSRLEECDGRRLQEALRLKGAEAGQDDPFWTELVPIGPERPVRAERTTFEWIGEEMVFTGEVFGDGSAKGLEGLKRGGSAFGQLKYSEEEELWSHGDL